MPERCERRCSRVTSSSTKRAFSVEDRTGRRRQAEATFVDQTQDNQSSEAFGPASDTKLRCHCIGDLVATIGEPVRLFKHDCSRHVHADHSENCVLSASASRHSSRAFTSLEGNLLRIILVAISRTRTVWSCVTRRWSRRSKMLGDKPESGVCLHVSLVRSHAEGQSPSSRIAPVQTCRPIPNITQR